MFTVSAAQSEATDALVAARTVVRRLARRHAGPKEHGAVLLFANAMFERPALLAEFQAALPTVTVVGCTTSAELGSDIGLSEWSLTAMQFASDRVTFGAGLGLRAAEDPVAAARRACAEARARLTGAPALCLLLAEGLAARDPRVLEALTEELGTDCVIAGAAASRPMGEPCETALFFGEQVVRDALVVLIMAGPLSVRHRVCSGWSPLGQAREVTEADGVRLLRIGEQTAVQYYRHYLGPHVDPTRGFPLAVFEGGENDFYTRVPIGFDEQQGSVTFGAPIPKGASVRLVEATADSILEGLERTVGSLGSEVGASPAAALVFSCNLRKGILGTRAPDELKSFSRSLPAGSAIAGFYGFAEMGPTATGGPARLHNATLVALVLATDEVDEPRDSATLPPPTEASSDRRVELERENRVLQRKLARSEYYRRDLEKLRDGHDRMLKRFHAELTELYTALDQEKIKSDRLLRNILPDAIALELKEHGRVAAVHHPSATILFTDFSGFTQSASRMSAHELVSELDLYFTEFDDIIGRYSLEKLKTIGDAYMCAGGVPSPAPTHVLDTVHAAWEIKRFCDEMVARRRARGRDAWQVRIGIHTGPLLAGVIGQKKFAYDVWGDSVNVAARLESTSEAGRINVSKEVYREVRDLFACEYRGRIAIKNRGELDMYFVNGPVVRASRDHALPSVVPAAE